ncbi:hypothetical protein ACFL24_02130 [Patescibacteria group bacterium]
MLALIVMMVPFSFIIGGSYFEAPPPLADNIFDKDKLPIAVIPTSVGIFSPHREPAMLVKAPLDNAPRQPQRIRGMKVPLWLWVGRLDFESLLRE